MTKQKLIVVLFTMLCFSGISHAYDVIAFGDSVTSGYMRNSARQVITRGCGGGDKCGGAIPYLESYLDNNLEPSNVYNWGWPGERTGRSNNGSPGGIYRLDGVLNTGSSDDIVLLMEGLNDIIGYLSSGDIINNMEIMINKVKAKNMYPILGLTTPNTNNENFYRTGRSTVNPALARMADRKGVKWVDHFRHLFIDTSWGQNNSGDLLHLSSTGSSRLAKGWYDAIKEYHDEQALILGLKRQLSNINSQIVSNNQIARNLKNQITALDDYGDSHIVSLKNQAVQYADQAIQSQVSSAETFTALQSSVALAQSRRSTQLSNIQLANTKIDEIEKAQEEIDDLIVLIIEPLL